MTTDPKRDHTLYSVLITKTKTLAIPLPWALFFSFFFSKYEAPDHLLVITIITMIISRLHYLALDFIISCLHT
jgi:hypothetical protein